MLRRDKRIHTTLNLSATLINEAVKIFHDMTKTEVIHEALRRMVRAEKLKNHAMQWAGNVRIAGE